MVSGRNFKRKGFLLGFIHLNFIFGRINIFIVNIKFRFSCLNILKLYYLSHRIYDLIIFIGVQNSDYIILVGTHPPSYGINSYLYIF